MWKRQWHPTPVLLPGKCHGWRSLAGYSPWGCKESDTTKQLHFLSFSYPVDKRDEQTRHRDPWCERRTPPVSAKRGCLGGEAQVFLLDWSVIKRHSSDLVVETSQVGRTSFAAIRNVCKQVRMYLVHLFYK